MTGSPDLVCGANDRDAASKSTANPDFDVIPIQRDGRLIGYFERETLKAGASCTITVTFTPSADGKRTANASVSDNGGGSPQTVALSGTGTGT
jgi:hypothetical protein